MGVYVCVITSLTLQCQKELTQLVHISLHKYHLSVASEGALKVIRFSSSLRAGIPEREVALRLFLVEYFWWQGPYLDGQGSLSRSAWERLSLY